MQNQTGFTLVELVVVILIGGILAVTVLPKFFSVEDETLQGQRDQLLALTHQLQQQSMQDTANLSATCPTLVINTTAAGFA
ncbi:MAG: type II secretion system GspH family protein, partial [Gammaproteobacteria bacterium]|nr:type II secretion system GspH family protein [Gammaproteobacteria bacterium]